MTAKRAARYYLRKCAKAFVDVAERGDFANWLDAQRAEVEPVIEGGELQGVYVGMSSIPVMSQLNVVIDTWDGIIFVEVSNATGSDIGSASAGLVYSDAKKWNAYFAALFN